MIFSTKTICVVAFIGFILAINWFLWMYERSHYCINNSPKASERCSADYPSFSVVLDLSVTLPDGSLQSTDGTVYTDGSYWESDGILRGCPCSLKPCVRSCCPPGQELEPYEPSNVSLPYYLSESPESTDLQLFKCVKGNVSMILNDTTEDPLDTETVFKNHFSVLPSEYKWLSINRNICFYSVDPSSSCCNIRNGALLNVTALKCSSRYPELYIDSSICRTIRISFLWIMIGMHVATLTVFTLVPSLKTGYGKEIISYVVAQLLLKSIVLSQFHTNDVIPVFHFGTVKLYIYGEYFADLSIRGWQIAIAHQIYTTFKPANVFIRQSTKDRFLIHSLFAWGVPTIMAGMRGLQLSNTYEEITLLEKTGLFIGYYYDKLNLILEIIAMILCAATLYRIRTYHKELDNIENSESQRHNAPKIQWHKIFLKVSLITGVDYIAVTIFLIFDRPPFLNVFPQFFVSTLYYFQIARGAEILFVFVFKAETWRSLKNWFDLRRSVHTKIVKLKENHNKYFIMQPS